MRWVAGLLLLILLGLQYRLWFGEGSLAQKTDLERRVDTQRQHNQQLESRNSDIALEVETLKSGLDGVEERARTDLGMVREGETFFMVIEDNDR